MAVCTNNDHWNQNNQCHEQWSLKQKQPVSRTIITETKTTRVTNNDHWNKNNQCHEQWSLKQKQLVSRTMITERKTTSVTNNFLARTIRCPATKCSFLPYHFVSVGSFSFPCANNLCILEAQFVSLRQCVWMFDCLVDWYPDQLILQLIDRLIV